MTLKGDVTKRDPTLPSHQHPPKIQLMNALNDIRYSERLCQRTARLYRHLQATFTFLSVLGGSSLLINLHSPELQLAGVITLAISGALNLAMRPADKAAAADADAKRYAQLRAKSHEMNETELQAAVNKLREGDTPEVDALRDVAYNDVVREIGRPDAQADLHFHQKLLRAIA